LTVGPTAAVKLCWRPWVHYLAIRDSSGDRLDADR